jgi:hypothetical protein
MPHHRGMPDRALRLTESAPLQVGELATAVLALYIEHAGAAGRAALQV